jgi:hypothetical protein
VKKDATKLLCICLSSLALITIIFIPIEEYIYQEFENFFSVVLLNTLFFWTVLLLAFGFQLVLMIDQNGKFITSLKLVDLVTMLTLTCFLFVGVGQILNFSFNVESRKNINEYSGDPIKSVNQKWAYLEGQIGRTTLDTLLKLDKKKKVDFLKLDSTGGLIQIAIEISKYVAAHDILIIVRNECSSACVLIAVSGKRLFTTDSAQFGFHNAASITKPGSEQGKFQSSVGSDIMFSFLKANGIPNDIIEAAKSTNTNDMHYVSGSELIKLGIAEKLK